LRGAPGNSAHTSLTGGNIPHLDCSTSTVLLWLLPSRVLPYLLFPLLLLCNPLPLSLFLGLGLCFSPGFLSRILSTMGFRCLLQSKEELLLLLMLLLHLTALLLEHLGVVLRNVGRGGGRHNDAETKAKNFLFCLCIVDLGTITGFSDKPNRTSKAQS